MTKTRDLADLGGGFIQAGSGAVQRTVEAKLQDVVSVKDFGAVGDGVADDRAAIQAALDYAKPLGKTVVLPSGTYGISSPLVNNSTEVSVNYLWPTTPNGVLLEGHRATIKALSGFPANRGMIELDSNPTDQQDYQPGGIPYCQVRNNISGIKFDGNNIAERGLYLRGTYYSSFSNLVIENLAGGSNDGAIHFGGVITATKDDVDTVGTCSFSNIQIQQCDGYGVLAVNNRPSHITFSKVVARNVVFSGFRMCGAFLTFRECITVNCGSEANSQTGGYQIIKGATGALTRAVHFLNCGFEANAWYEFSIEYCNTWSINGCGGTPYKNTYATGQTLIQAGTGADAVTSGAILSNRFQTFGNYAVGTVTAIKAGANCTDLLIGSNDIDDFYYTFGVVYDINAAVELISIGQQSTDPLEPKFNVGNDVYVNKDGVLCVKRTGIVQAGNQIAVQGTGSGTIFGLSLGATSGSIDAIGFSDDDGTLCGKITCDTTANTTSYTTTSDYRLKENVVPIANASGRIKQLHPCRFNFIEDPLRTFDGFIAHEVQAVIPEAIVGAKDAVDEEGQIIPQGIDHSKIVPLLTAALQEALQRIEILELQLNP